MRGCSLERMHPEDEAPLCTSAALTAFRPRLSQLCMAGDPCSAGGRARRPAGEAPGACAVRGAERIRVGRRTAGTAPRLSRSAWIAQHQRLGINEARASPGLGLMFTGALLRFVPGDLVGAVQRHVPHHVPDHHARGAWACDEERDARVPEARRNSIRAPVSLRAASKRRAVCACYPIERGTSHARALSRNEPSLQRSALRILCT
jgi:hypothetical protein